MKNVVDLRKETIKNRDGERVVIWEVLDSEPVRNKAGVYIFVSLLVLLGIGLIYFGTNITLAVLLFLFGLIVLLNIWKNPDKIRVMINQKGIYINEALHPYREIQSFWLNYELEEKSLILTMKKWYLPYLKICIGHKSPFEIKDVLGDYLEEKRIERSLLDAIIKMIGF